MSGEFVLPTWVEFPALAHGDLDAIAREVSRRLDVPIALVTCVARSGQTMPGATGLTGTLEADRATPLSYSICRYVVTSDEPLVVPDMRAHPILRLHPAIDDMGVLAYVGVPLRNPDGQPYGALCALSSDVREWRPDEVDWLVEQAREVSLRLRAYATDLHLADAVAAADRARVTASSNYQGAVDGMAVAVSAVWRHGVLNTFAASLDGVVEGDRVAGVVGVLGAFAAESLETSDAAISLHGPGAEAPFLMGGTGSVGALPNETPEERSALTTAAVERRPMLLPSRTVGVAVGDVTPRSTMAPPTGHFAAAFLPVPVPTAGLVAVLVLRWRPGTPSPDRSTLLAVARLLGPSLEAALLTEQGCHLLALAGGRDDRPSGIPAPREQHTGPPSAVD